MHDGKLRDGSPHRVRSLATGHLAAPNRKAARALARALGTLLARAGEEGRIVSVRVRPSPYRSTHALEEVSLRFDDNRVVHLVLKTYGAGAVLESSGPRPRFVADPYRELWAYENVVGPLRVGAPRLYGTLEPKGAGAGQLVLERVRGAPLSEVGELDAWTATAAWLAQFHTRGEPVAGRLAASGHPLNQDAALHSRWLPRARQHALERNRVRELDALEQIASTYGRAVRRLAERPRTVLHGELYASNVIVHRSGRRWVVRPVDWEAMAVGPAVLDLAGLVSGRWDGDRRAAIVDAYGCARGVPRHSRETFWDLLACARLVIAVQWLGWAKNWTPPSEHAHDWLEEAARAAEAVVR
jgi:hypothetical protein